jgi:hypothetical protein
MTNDRVIYKTHASSAWYSSPELVKLARRVLGGQIDLDPCTHADNPTGAAIFMTHRDRRHSCDGRAWASKLSLATGKVRHDASGEARPVRTLWLNPPFGNGIAAWLAAVYECRAELEARGLELACLIIVPARTDAAWYATLSQGVDVVSELHGRPRFWVRRGGAFVPAKHGARWGCSLFYVGPEVERAFDELEAVGSTRYARVRRRARARAPVQRRDPRQLELADRGAAGNVVPIRPVQ